MPDLQLFSDGLLSKWGFTDGDVPDELDDWLNERGVDPDPSSWRLALCVLVRERLLPALDQAVEAMDIDTIHNPIRATVVDGAVVDEDVWYGRADGPTLTPDVVLVPLRGRDAGHPPHGYLTK